MALALKKLVLAYSETWSTVLTLECNRIVFSFFKNLLSLTSQCLASEQQWTLALDGFYTDTSHVPEIFLSLGKNVLLYVFAVVGLKPPTWLTLGSAVLLSSPLTARMTFLRVLRWVLYSIWQMTLWPRFYKSGLATQHCRSKGPSSKPYQEFSS